MRSVITFAAMALVAGSIVPRYAEHVNHQTMPGPATASAPSTAERGASGFDSVVVPRDNSGHFRVEANVDGRRLAFIVDTGASVIALTADDASSLGIHPFPVDYTVLLKTANGTVRAAPATLGLVEIGDIMVHDVAAVVLPDSALSENLLGLSFLSRLRHFEYSRGKLVLEQ